VAIVVGDIHGNVEKAQVFLNYKPDAVHIALGDYLDSFTESLERQIECLNLLMDSRAVMLLGNHECHYLQSPLFRFPGYKPENAGMLQKILEGNLDRFKVAFAVDGWLCTHAGVKSQLTELQSDVTALADAFNSKWQLYLKYRLENHQARYVYQSIFEFNYCIFVEGNLLAENIKQIFGHVEHSRPIIEPHYIALDTTNYSSSCWILDTEENELVQLSLC
jgi:hypothetical protein